MSFNNRFTSMAHDMTEPNAPAVASEEQALVLTRTFDAPRDLVFKAFTEKESLAQWWAPTGATMVVRELDLRPGGTFHYGWTMGDGPELWGKFVYREIVAPELIVLVNSFADAEGNIVRCPFPQMENWPLEVLSTFVFSDHEGGTKLSMHGIPVNATAEEIALFASFRGSMEQGFGASFAQLDAFLAGS
jgi:uncharacterized protein YndB with AHSA1/START domain